MEEIGSNNVLLDLSVFTVLTKKTKQNKTPLNGFTAPCAKVV